MIDTDSNENFDCDIFYVSKTSIEFCFMLEQQGSNRNVIIKFKWLTQSRMKKPITKEIMYAILKHFGDDVFSQKIIGVTEIKKKCTIYWANNCY